MAAGEESGHIDYQEIYDKTPWYGNAAIGRCPGVRLLPKYQHWISGKVLDLGSGRGHTVEAIHKLGFDCDGIDMISCHPDMKSGDITKPLDMLEYGTAICIDVVEHIPDGPLEGLMKNMAQVDRCVFSIHKGSSVHNGKELHVNRKLFSTWRPILRKYFDIVEEVRIHENQSLFICMRKHVDLKRRMAIIGNAPLCLDWLPSDTTGWCERIDTADKVLRFNVPAGYPNTITGKRVDIWSVASDGAPVRSWVKPHAALVTHIADRADELWIPMPEGYVATDHIKSSKEQGRRIAEELTYHKRPHKTFSWMDPAAYAGLIEKLTKIREKEGIKKPFIPSTGMAGVHRAVTDPRFKGWVIEYTGFTHRGYKGHPFSAESVYMKELVGEGRLENIQRLKK
jgi:hypothetical protein